VGLEGTCRSEARQCELSSWKGEISLHGEKLGKKRKGQRGLRRCQKIDLYQAGKRGKRSALANASMRQRNRVSITAKGGERKVRRTDSGLGDDNMLLS